jgi:hypothetical protein
MMQAVIPTTTAMRRMQRRQGPLSHRIVQRHHTPHLHSSSEDTATGEATADGGKIEAGDDASDGDSDSDTTETDASPSLSTEPDSIRNPDENAPETQAERLRVFKDTLDESTKNGEFVTADELEADLGWDRSLIDGYLAKLRRESALIGEENMGWKYYE